MHPPLAPPRKLIEVALPLEAVNAAGRAEKAVPKKGHPATMHLWWSRKPLGVTRAVLFASLVDDPSARPDLFPTEAAQEVERRRLFALIEELCRWERSGDAALLAEAQRCIEDSAGGDPPRIIDPFCGGGAISVEALRLGLDTLAIDLNPVAALVSAATVAIAQRFAGTPPVHPAEQAEGGGLAGIAADVAYYGAVVETECRRRLAMCQPGLRPHHPVALHVVVVEEAHQPMACAPCSHRGPLRFRGRSRRAACRVGGSQGGPGHQLPLPVLREGERCRLGASLWAGVRLRAAAGGDPGLRRPPSDPQRSHLAGS